MPVPSAPMWPHPNPEQELLAPGVVELNTLDLISLHRNVTPIQTSGYPLRYASLVFAERNIAGALYLFGLV
jgi:hypothetical protein